MALSSAKPAPVYEIWLFASPDYREPVQECGVFANELDAVHVARLLRCWLHEGVWNDNLLDGSARPVDDAYPLLMLREELAAQDIDPTRVYVGAVRRGAAHDNAVAVPAEAVELWRTHGRHESRRPVKAKRW